ncbi:uncharacterized protein LOC117343950 [Pecten maximus]|uniref:uncharacterized protein LOC117343950 n=1 Tax=Pecten maximus TaxID=6579 RepID=UPI001458A510|nr:uncharacterized protein LOC117343950 [Pecten maximus]
MVEYYDVNREFLDCDDFIVGDVRVGSHRHLMFATPTQLRLLQQARRWYCDGTFKIRREPFQQLWSIHAFLQQDGCTKQVPLCFVLMSRRTAEDYEAVLRHLLTCFESSPEVEGFMLDFEAGCWRAVRSVFPGVDLKGCSFHWAQAVLRKVDSLGLRATFRKRQGVAEYIRKLMALPFLPSPQIHDAFVKLKRLANTPELTQLVDYLDRYWFRSGVWSTANWCVHRQSVRTNNDVEGWHRRINTKARRANLPFYMLVPLLHQEGRLVTLQMRLVAEQALRRQQTTVYRRIQGKIQTLWDQYAEQEISSSTFLKTVGKIYCPATVRPTPDDE